MELKEILERKFLINIRVLNILATARGTKYTIKELQRFDKDLGVLKDDYEKTHKILEGRKVQEKMAKELNLAIEESHSLYVLITGQVDRYLAELKIFGRNVSKEISTLYKNRKLDKTEYIKFRRILVDEVGKTMNMINKEIRTEYQKLLDVAGGTTTISTTFMEKIVEAAKAEGAGFGAYLLIRREESVLLIDLGKLKKDSEKIISKLRRLINKKPKNLKAGELKKELDDVKRDIVRMFEVVKQGTREAYLIIMRDCLFKFRMLEDAKKLENLDKRYAEERLIPQKFADDFRRKVDELFGKMKRKIQEELDELRREAAAIIQVERGVSF